MTNTNTVVEIEKPANVVVQAKAKLGKQITHIIENLPTGLEMSVRMIRGEAQVSIGFIDETQITYADLLAGDALYEELSETVTMLMNSSSAMPSLIVEKNHAKSTPTAAIAMLEQLLQGTGKKDDNELGHQ